MTLLDVQHVKKVYKTRFKGNQVEALKISILRLKRVSMLQSWVSLAQENQPCPTFLPCLINQRQGVSTLMVWTQKALKIRMLPVSVVKD